MMKPFLVFFCSWLIPGSGHYLLGKRVKAAIFFGGILSLVVLGLLMGGGVTTLYDMKPLTLLGFIGSVGSGLFYFVMKLAGLGVGDISAYTYLYGTTYISVAGFLNLLIAFRTYGLAKDGENV